MQIASCKYIYDGGAVVINSVNKMMLCPIAVSKTTRELQLFWSTYHQAVSISQDLKMPQFTIEKVSSTVCNEQFHMGNYSCLVAQFHMKRSVSFHLIQSYLPSILIVAISWVSFWMDLDSVPGRISLGVITLLAVSSQAGLGNGK